MRKTMFSYCSVVAALALLAGGCSTGGRADENKKAVQSIADVSKELDKAKAGVDKTVALLGQIQQDGGTEKSFKEYSDSVDDLQAAGETAAKRGAEMRERRAEYMAKWQTEIEAMDNPDIKKSLQERATALRANYDDMTAKAQDVREAYRIFLKDAQDVRAALKIDLTPAGVKAMDPSINTAKAAGADLSSKLQVFNGEVAELQGKLAPQAPPPPPTQPAK